MSTNWSEHIQNIEKQSKAILEGVGVDSPPVPVRRVAEHLDVKVRPSEFGDNVSGLLTLEGERPTIGYNSQHSEVRRRFTIAHEIGHFIRHHETSTLFIEKGYGKVFFRNDRSSEGEYTRELEANAFAASLLMPEAMLREEISRRDFDLAEENVLSELAELFKVSRQAMTYRLANSGVFDSVSDYLD